MVGFIYPGTSPGQLFFLKRPVAIAQPADRHPTCSERTSAHGVSLELTRLLTGAQARRLRCGRLQ